MNRLININSKDQIPAVYKDTPIGLLLEYHNLRRPLEEYTTARLLVGMCMDNRKHLTIPNNFSFIIRAGGTNLRYSEFKISYAIAIGQIKYIALISHNNCGMVNLAARKTDFINGMVSNAGWDKSTAEEHFNHFAPLFEIGNSIDFVLSEANRLKLRYPGITIVPMHYLVEDNKLYLISS